MTNQQTIEDQSIALVQAECGQDWVVVGIAERKHGAAWGHEGRCFLVALRKPEHADLPFPGPLPQGLEDIPNRAIFVFWQGQNYSTLDGSELYEFSQNQNKPTINKVMKRFRSAVRDSEPSRKFIV